MAESKACHLAAQDAQDAQDWPVGLHSQKWDWNKWSEKKNYKSNMNESDSVVKWWDPILNCTSFNQCMGMKSTAFTPQALMISVRTET